MGKAPARACSPSPSPVLSPAQPRGSFPATRAPAAGDSAGPGPLGHHQRRRGPCAHSAPQGAGGRGGRRPQHKRRLRAGTHRKGRDLPRANRPGPAAAPRHPPAPCAARARQGRPPANQGRESGGAGRGLAGSAPSSARAAPSSEAAAPPGPGSTRRAAWVPPASSGAVEESSLPSPPPSGGLGPGVFGQLYTPEVVERRLWKMSHGCPWAERPGHKVLGCGR